MFKVFDKVNGFLCFELGKWIRFCYVFELIFKIDELIVYGSWIEKLFGDIGIDKNEF